MATHFPNHVFYMENNDIPVQVGLMDQGGLKGLGKPSEVLTQENIHHVFRVHSEILSIPVPIHPDLSKKYETSNREGAKLTNINTSKQKWKNELKHVVPLSTIKEF